MRDRCAMDPTVLFPAHIRAGLSRADAIWDGPAPAPRRLTVSYLFTHHGVTGGLRIFVEHVVQLRTRGHRMRAITRGDARNAFPPWTDARTDEDVVLPRGTPLGPGLAGSDVVVVGTYWPPRPSPPRPRRRAGSPRLRTRAARRRRVEG